MLYFYKKTLTYNPLEQFEIMDLKSYFYDLLYNFNIEHIFNLLENKLFYLNNNNFNIIIKIKKDISIGKENIFLEPFSSNSIKTNISFFKFEYFFNK